MPQEAVEEEIELAEEDPVEIVVSDVPIFQYCQTVKKDAFKSKTVNCHLIASESCDPCLDVFNYGTNLNYSPPEPEE